MDELQYEKIKSELKSMRHSRRKRRTAEKVQALCGAIERLVCDTFFHIEYTVGGFGYQVQWSQVVNPAFWGYQSFPSHPT